MLDMVLKKNICGLGSLHPPARLGSDKETQSRCLHPWFTSIIDGQPVMHQLLRLTPAFCSSGLILLAFPFEGPGS